MDVKQIPKILRETASLAYAQGWDIEKTSGGHLKWTPPDKSCAPVITGSTMSDHRAHKNTIRDLRKSGFVDDPQEWAGIQRLRLARDVVLGESDLIQTIHEYVASLSEADGYPWTKSQRDAVEWAYVEVVARGIEFDSLSPDHLENMDFSPSVGRLGQEFLSCECGFQGSVADVARHCMDPATGYARVKHGLVVSITSPRKGKMKIGVRAVDKNMIACPVSGCDFACYKSQADQLDSHLRTHDVEGYDFSRCPYCSMVVESDNLSFHCEHECSVMADLEEAEPESVTTEELEVSDDLSWLVGATRYVLGRNEPTDDECQSCLRLIQSTRDLVHASSR